MGVGAHDHGQPRIVLASWSQLHQLTDAELRWWLRQLQMEPSGPTEKNWMIELLTKRGAAWWAEPHITGVT